MLVIDCHVHSWGGEDAGDIVRSMDEHGLDKIVVFSPYPGVLEDEYSSKAAFSSRRQREVAEHVAKLQAEFPDRIIGFLWLEPRLKDAVELLEWAVSSLELKGVKMIPYGWYPYEEKLLAVYEKVEELGVPAIFHSGILFGFVDSSRYCRPVNYEVLIRFPKLRFALAHIGWPWVDECIALWGRFRAASQRGKREIQMYIDATPGTPTVYRRDALQRVLAYGAGDWLLFGSDSTTRNLSRAAEVLRNDARILREQLGMPEQVLEKYIGLNALRFLGLG